MLHSAVSRLVLIALAAVLALSPAARATEAEKEPQRRYRIADIERKERKEIRFAQWLYRVETLLALVTFGYFIDRGRARVEHTSGDGRVSIDVGGSGSR